ncbi:MAG TPA: hypothetical protein VFS43_09600 [Polyangiaceae bacterium]|nr:hypothetical protein [Polyangiaceae bacterium]
MAARVSGLAAACLLAGGCQWLLDLDEAQCRTDGECVERGLEAGVRCIDERCRPVEAVPTGPWACLGRVEIPRPTGAMVPFELQVRDIASNLGLAGATARLCGRNDSTCSAPFSTPQTADGEGYLSWTVPDSFDGYAEVSLAGYANSLYYPQVSYIRRGAGGRGPYVSLGTPATLEGLAVANGASRDPAAGDVLLYVVDCDGRPAAGVRFETESVLPNTLPFYLVNRVPLGTATSTDAVVGGGGYVNLPARFVSFRAYVVETGQTITNVSVLVRPGHVSFAVAEPSP